MGFVEVPEGLCVEARSCGFGGGTPRTGEQVTLTAAAFRTDDAGNEVVIPAFTPNDSGPQPQGESNA